MDSRFLKLKGKFVVRKIDDEIFALPIGEDNENVIIELSGTALDVWELLEKGIEFGDLIRNLSQKYDVDINVLCIDIEKFLEICKNNNILEDVYNG